MAGTIAAFGLGMNETAVTSAQESVSTLAIRKKPFRWALYIGTPLGIGLAAAVVQSLKPAASRRTSRSSRPLWLGASAGLVFVAFARWQFQRLVTPGPKFEPEGKRGALEIRRYPAMVVARTTTEGDWDHALDNGFRRLADFIFGMNTADEHVAMTTPVLGVRDGEEFTFRFCMPSGEHIPQPLDQRVRLETLPSRRVAVLRWAGAYDGPTVDEKKRELLEAVTGLETFGEPIFAGYDPPSTLPLLRRNEVWIEIA